MASCDLLWSPRSILEASYRQKIIVAYFDASLSQILVLTAAVCTCIDAGGFILVLVGRLRLRNVSKTMGTHDPEDLGLSMHTIGRIEPVEKAKRYAT